MTTCTRASTSTTKAFGLTIGRRFGGDAVELLGATSPIYLLAKPNGTVASATSRHLRSYARHWTPVHLDIVVDEIDGAVDRARNAGARLEGPVKTNNWGKIAMLADPFGHGICLIEFVGRGYDEIATEKPQSSGTRSGAASDGPSMPELVCWKCGASLADLTLPLLRLEECRKCGAELHVCKLCEWYSVDRREALPRADRRGSEGQGARELLRLLQAAARRVCAGGRRRVRQGALRPGCACSAARRTRPEPTAADKRRAELDKLFKKK